MTFLLQQTQLLEVESCSIANACGNTANNLLEFPRDLTLSNVSCNVCHNSIGESRSLNIAYCKNIVRHNSGTFYHFLTYLNWYIPGICVWFPDICTILVMDRHHLNYLHAAYSWFCRYTCPARVLVSLPWKYHIPYFAVVLYKRHCLSITPLNQVYYTLSLMKIWTFPSNKKKIDQSLRMKMRNAWLYLKGATAPLGYSEASVRASVKVGKTKFLLLVLLRVKERRSEQVFNW